MVVGKKLRRRQILAAQRVRIAGWGTGPRRLIPLDRLWHHKDVTKAGLAGANGRRLREPFKVWEGDHPNCTTEIKARLLVAPRTRTVVGCTAEARWGTDIWGFLGKLAELYAPTTVHLVAMPGLGTPAFSAFVVLFVAKRPRPVERAYLESLRLTMWDPKDPGALRQLPKRWVARFKKRN